MVQINTTQDIGGEAKVVVQTRDADYVRNNGIKQTFISKKTGISACTISAILTNRRKMTADEFEQICIAIGKSPNDFMVVKEDP